MNTHKNNVPVQWKAATVAPIFKSGNEERTNNYWSISVLPIVSTVRKDFVILQLCWWLFCSTKHCR